MVLRTLMMRAMLVMLATAVVMLVMLAILGMMLVMLVCLPSFL